MPDRPLIIEEPIGDEVPDDPSSVNIEDIEPESEPSSGSPADKHSPPLDDPADSKFLVIGDPRRAKTARSRTGDRRWH